ncbi:MAG: tetratricopeptide repeat protein [Caldimicrobium sp.]|nr:tetratricopeptide repeat protein [Caldimicrobium sp.]MCX7873991.1 tetratricopeptide repeat protein [Caldimicrobium sp.]MDW8094139.1 tetratricopeptide repeat protein [Caldimicrobium sp.]
MRLLYLVFSLFLFSGCVALQQDDVSSLKIKILNLETLSQRQANRIAELERKVDMMESKLTKEFTDRFLQAQIKMTSDLEETKRELALLQSKMEEMHFQREAEGKNQRKALEELNSKIEAQNLRIKKIETKIEELARIKDLISNLTQASPPSQPPSAPPTPPPSPPPTPPPSQPLSPPQGPLQPSDHKTLSQPIANVTLMETPPKGQPLVDKTKENKTNENKTIASAKTPLKEDDLYQKAFSHYEKGNLKEAKSTWEEYVQRFPKGKWIGQSYFYLGEIAMKEKDFETAILEYQKLIEMPGANPLKPKAILRQAEAFLALKDKKAAEILLKKVIKNYPGTIEAKEAEKKLRELK